MGGNLGSPIIASPSPVSGWFGFGVEAKVHSEKSRGCLVGDGCPGRGLLDIRQSDSGAVPRANESLGRPGCLSISRFATDSPEAGTPEKKSSHTRLRRR